MPDAIPPSETEKLAALAERYVWWAPAERTLESKMPRLVAQVMELGTWEDAHTLLRIVGADAFVAVLRSPPAGTFSPRSWHFWHRRLGLGTAPALPAGRTLPDLGPLGAGTTAQAEPNTLVSFLDRGGAIKVSFFGGIGSGRVGEPEPTDDGCIRVASPLDLLATKLKTILQRSDSKDYRDIAALLRAGVSLAEGLGGAAALFPPSFPVASSIKALSYFEDLEDADLLSTRDREYLLESTDQLGDVIPTVPLVSGTLAT